MDFDNKFYKQWKTKQTDHHQLFIEKSEFSKEIILDSEKIFSSTAIEDQAETESFSLRLSESYVDETQESVESKPEPKQLNEVIMISDSSTDESIFSNNKNGNANKMKYTNDIKAQTRKGIYILESSDDESYNNPIRDTAIKKSDKVNSIMRTLSIQSNRRKVIIEESDSETEQTSVPQIIKDTVAESLTLSERKKKEILQWLSTNVDGSRCGSSCSQESAISNSRKSGVSSGNSSLERLELNFETPNNRGKLSKPGTVEKSNKKNQRESEQQNKIDKYLIKTKQGQLNIVKDRTPGSKNSDKTPINKVKANPRRLIIPESESFDSRSPGSRSSDKTPINKTNANSKRIIIPESESFDSRTSESQKSDKNPISNIKTNLKRIIPESESFDSRTPGSQKSDKIPINNLKTNSKRIIIPETQSFESTDQLDTFKKLCSPNYTDKILTNKLIPQKSSVIIPESLEISDDVVHSDDSPDVNLRNKENAQKNDTETKNTTINTTVNDCADILENLYGATWRDKAKSLVSATEPRKQTTKKLIKVVQTEKKITFRKPRLDYDTDSELSNKETDFNVPTKRSQTTSKKTKSRNKIKDSFVNDESTTESSPDCSYYTALSNPAASQNNQLKTETTSTIKRNDKNNLKKVLSICDSESELDDENWKNRDNNQRKLSFDSSTSSSTSEFDPEDIVPPRIVTKNIKLKKTVNFEAVKSKVIQQPAKQTTKSFLASLSKNVPLGEADFKAMTFRVKYNTMKEELCKVLYKLFNEKVFDNQLPDNMSIEWSVRLRGTAGKCYNKQSLKALGNTVRSSRIVLATKVLDSPDRLRDTLIHEMCHAATWLINNVSDGHGSFWKAWADKAMKVFPELPRIARCHDYEIQTKYTYKCTSCGYSIGRHSKSLDLNRKRCGYCHGMFELLINKITKDGKVQKKSTAQTKEPTGFALYVKENYQLVKQNAAGVKHGEVMKILGQQFSAVKITPRPEDRIRNNEDESP